MKKKDLHTKKLTSGFTVPENYFEYSANDIMNRIANEAAIPENDGFTIPDAYFENAEARLLETIKEKESNVNVISLRKRTIFTYISYAAAACLLLFVSIQLFNTEEELSLDTVDTTEINTFIENDLIALNNYELINAYEEEDIDISTIFEVELNETETIDYLENTTDSYDLLIEQ